MLALAQPCETLSRPASGRPARGRRSAQLVVARGTRSRVYTSVAAPDSVSSDALAKAYAQKSAAGKSEPLARALPPPSLPLEIRLLRVHLAAPAQPPGSQNQACRAPLPPRVVPSTPRRSCRPRWRRAGVRPSPGPSRPLLTDRVWPTPSAGRIIFQGVHHVALLCASLERSLDFYCSVLGLEVRPAGALRSAASQLPPGAGLEHASGRPLIPTRPCSPTTPNPHITPPRTPTLITNRSTLTALTTSCRTAAPGCGSAPR